jgi:methionyl-tRNA formyltransferase
MKVLLIGEGILGRSILQGLMPLVVDPRVQRRYQMKPTAGPEGVWQPGPALIQQLTVWCWSNSKKGSKRSNLTDDERAFRADVRAWGLPSVKLQGVNTETFRQWLHQHRPDLVLLGSWGEIFKPKTLAWFNETDPTSGLPLRYLINCHPSPLPAYRGANPYFRVIQHGETQTHVTFHLITPGIDEGPILAQLPIPILPSDTGGALRQRCAEVAGGYIAQIVQRVVEARQAGTPLAATPQDESQATYFPQITLADGALDFHQPVAAQVRQIYGLQPWLDAYTFIGSPSGWWLVSCRGALVADGIELPPDYPPGTFVCVTRDALWITTAEPGRVIGLHPFRVYWGWRYWNHKVSLFLARRLFCQGYICQSK